MYTPSCLHLRQRTVPIFMLGGLLQTASAAVVSALAGNNLAEIVAQAQAGNILKLASGAYKTKLYVDKPLTIEGPADRSAKIQGDRSGRTIAVHALNVVSCNLTVTQSGLNLPAMDAGVYLEETAANALVESNNILENSVGMYLHGPKNAMVRGNKIADDIKLRVAERGNGVTVWNVPGPQVVGNDVSQGRDGIFSNISTSSTYKNNRFSHLRYAVHYMYINDSEVSGNISVGNNIGYALMFSDHPKVYGNIAVGSHDQGIMLSYVNYSDIANNVIYKADKCVFVHNANYNDLHGNYFENCDISIHFTAAIEGTKLIDNSFISNEGQVKYVSTCSLDWGEGGRGSYRSDNGSFDLDGDGSGDDAHRPNGVTGQIIWHTLTTRLLMNSPAVSIAKWAQSQFPAILLGGAADSKPLMKPFANGTMTKYQAMKDRLVKEVQSQKSEWNSAGNGAISDGGMQPLRRDIRMSSQSPLSDGLKVYRGRLKKQSIHKETSMSTNHAELRNVAKRFDKQRAVNQVDLVLKAGESAGLAGYSGTGKPTITKLTLGLVTPSEGEIMLLGERTGSKAGAQVRTQIGYLPEIVALHPSLTGIETMAFCAKLKKQSSAKNRELPERVGILQAVGRRAGTYSKGMRQHLVLVQALSGEPKVLLFDEPTTGLDPASRQMFYEVVRELNGKGVTALFSTHTLAELDGHADRVVVMRNGVKVADDSADELHIRSGLLFTVTVCLREWVLPSECWQHSDGLLYRAQCKAEGRMALLGELGDLSRFNYTDIHTPTLDDMYAQLLKREEV